MITEPTRAKTTDSPEIWFGVIEVRDSHAAIACMLRDERLAIGRRAGVMESVKASPETVKVATGSAICR